MNIREIREQLVVAAQVGGETFTTCWGNACHIIASEIAHNGDIEGAQSLRVALAGLPLNKETEDALCILTGQVEPAIRKGKNGAKIFCHRRLHKGNVNNAVFDLEKAKAYLADWRTEYKDKRALGYSRGKLLLEQVRMMLPARKEERKESGATMANSINAIRRRVPNLPQAKQARAAEILADCIARLEALDN